MITNLLGVTVHFPETIGGSVFHQGEIVAVAYEKYEDGTDNLQVYIRCTDMAYRKALLLWCMAGARPETEEEKLERLRRRRDKEGR